MSQERKQKKDDLFPIETSNDVTPEIEEMNNHLEKMSNGLLEIEKKAKYVLYREISKVFLCIGFIFILVIFFSKLFSIAMWKSGLAFLLIYLLREIIVFFYGKEDQLDIKLSNATNSLEELGNSLDKIENDISIVNKGISDTINEK